MPTYEYKCQACDHTFERYQSITAVPVRTCPACGQRKVRRLIGSGAALLFKGNGFYQTDYRSKSYEQASKSETKAPSDQSKTGESGEGSSGSSKPNNAGSGGDSGSGSEQ